MKNKYIIFLLYLCASLILMIALIQINGLSNLHISFETMTPQLYFQFRLSHTVTLFLSLISVSILLAREGITRELKRKAYTDVTGIKNKHACMEEMSILDCYDNTLNTGFAMFDLNNLKKVNDFYGHEKGDELIQSFVALLRHASDKKYFLGRFGGDEFIVIIRNCTEEIMKTYIDQVKKLAENYNNGKSVEISFACGYAISTRNHYYLMEDLLNEADKNMYKNKKRMKSDSINTTSQLSKILDADRSSSFGRDALTGLFNHDSFLATVNKVMQLSDKDKNFAVICSDISNFRYINDTYGHQEGNHILKLFAKELTSQSFCLCACRLYSDNFAFLTELSDNSQEEVNDRVKNWCLQFSALINQTCKGSQIIINSGIYFFRNDMDSIGNALNYANAARKHTKMSPMNIHIYDDTLSELEKKKAEILNSFHTSLQNQEFKIFLQPKIDCMNQNICGAEALIRWKKNNGTILSYPDEFIPLLEQSGNIIEMDYYVYEQIFEYLHNQISHHKAVVPISMNVSRVHLIYPNDFIKHIRELLLKYPIPTSLILFELTESTYIRELTSAVIFIEELHKLGIKVSMDDFGSGYSSLAILKDLPFDEIKFDKSFLIDGDDNSKKILLQIMKLVKSLNKIIVCEGVEIYDSVTLLNQGDCDMMQGYYFFKPMPIDDFNLNNIQ